MLYTYKLPNGVLRLSDKAEYFADASDAYHSLAKVLQLYYFSLSLIYSTTSLCGNCALPDLRAQLQSIRGSKQLQKIGSLSSMP